MPGRQALAVDAVDVLVLHALVALAAGGGDVALVDGRLWVRGGEDLVGPMAVGARGRLQGHPSLDGLPVVALEEALQGVALTDTYGGHALGIAVASAARGGDVQGIDGGGGVALGPDLVGTVAVGAAGDEELRFPRGGMHSGLQLGRQVPVAAAGGCGQLFGVREFFDAIVAVHAGQAFVHRPFQAVLGNLKAQPLLGHDGLAERLVSTGHGVAGHARVRVALEAVLRRRNRGVGGRRSPSSGTEQAP